MRAIAALMLAGVTLVGGLDAGGRILDRDGRRVGEVRENVFGGYDVFAPDGRRLGYGRRSPYDPRVIEFFAPDGRRLLDVREPGVRRGR